MKKEIYICVEKHINAQKASVWNAVAGDFGGVSKYNPEIAASQFMNSIRSGVGTQRHCDFPKTGFIEEEITAWTAEDSFELQMIRSSVPMGSVRSKFSFESTDDGTTVTQEFWYKMKAPLGWLSPIMKKKMRNTLENGLTGLKKYLEEQNGLG